MHTITSRPPTDEERQVIVGQTWPDFASYGCLTLFLGVGPIFMLGWIGGWAGGFVSGEVGAWGRWVGGAVGVVIYFSALASFIPYERRLHKRATQDASGQTIEEITVFNPRVVEIGLISDNEPILAFDVGEGKLLLLQGQWLRDAVTYGAPENQGDPPEDFLNGFPEPYAFPSTSFTVIRLPHSGRVLGIRVTGHYLPPEQTIEALRPEYEFGDSELLQGSLAEIADVLRASMLAAAAIDRRPLPKIRLATAALLCLNYHLDSHPSHGSEVGMLSIGELTALHRELVIRWHSQPVENSHEGLVGIVCQQFSYNFLLWHEEDIARSPDVSDTRIAQVKRAIDKLNQQRNDWIEKIDDQITDDLARRRIEADSAAPQNTETLGSSLDRLSILALRIYHLEEQRDRSDATPEHRKSVAHKLAVARVQMADLTAAAQQLADDIYSGKKRHCTYRQLKMYNDPALNPYLYQARAA